MVDAAAGIKRASIFGETVTKAGVPAAYLFVSSRTESELEGDEKPLEAQCEDLLKSRFPEGLMNTLKGAFPGARSHDCEDAIAAGLLKLAKRGGAENPAGYVTTVAMNEMRRILTKAAREQLSLDEGDLEPDQARAVWTHVGRRFKKDVLRGADGELLRLEQPRDDAATHADLWRELERGDDEAAASG
ncbi:MAG: hypothetical protein AABM66_09870 [Actinomycetota bacterium]